MLTAEQLLSIGKDELAAFSQTLQPADLEQLVHWLSEKDDTLRYQALLLLEQRAAYADDVYAYWDTFRQKLGSDNSYQRSIGLMLIAANAEWDRERRLDEMIADYLQLLHDEKPITVRQCLQALSRIVPHKPQLCPAISAAAMAIDLAACRETMRKSILLDIITVLAAVRQQQSNDQIEAYIAEALAGDVLDRKTKRQVQQLMQQ